MLTVQNLDKVPQACNLSMNSVATYTDNNSGSKFYLKRQGNREMFQSLMSGVLYKLVLGDRAPEVGIAIGEEGKYSSSKELNNFITLNNLSAKYEGNAEGLSNYIKHLQGIDEVIAAIILFREHDYGDNNLGIIEKDGKKLLGKIDHDQSDFIKHFNCAINRFNDTIHLKVVLDSFAEHKMLQSLFNRESVEKKIIELSGSLNAEKKKISQILDENINLFFKSTSCNIKQLLNHKSVKLNNSDEKKIRYYFIAQDQENKKNIQDIYYFKLDDDKFYPYKEIDSPRGIFTKLEGPGLTFNELYIQEFFKRVEYCSSMEVSKNHTNQSNQEKSKESLSLSVHPPQNPQAKPDSNKVGSRPRVVPHIPIIVSRGNHAIQNEKQPQRKAQAKPNANKVKNIHDIFQISQKCCSFESYASGEGVAELSAGEIDKVNQHTKDIRRDSEKFNKFIKGIDEVRTRLMLALDNLDLEKYISEGKVEMLKKYLDVAERYFKATADILNECDALDDKDKFGCEYLIEKKLKRIKEIEKTLNNNTQGQNDPKTNGDAESEAQNESEQPQQSAQSADNIPNQEIKKNESNPQTTTNKPQGESNVYDNKGFGIKKIMGVVGAIAGAIIGATIAYLAGATLPIIAVIAVISAVPGVLIGCGIAEICERVSREEKNDPEKGILTALSIVLTPKCMSGGDVAKT